MWFPDTSVRFAVLSKPNACRVKHKCLLVSEHLRSCAHPHLIVACANLTPTRPTPRVSWCICDSSRFLCWFGDRVGQQRHPRDQVAPEQYNSCVCCTNKHAFPVNIAQFSKQAQARSVILLDKLPIPVGNIFQFPPDEISDL